MHNNIINKEKALFKMEVSRLAIESICNRKDVSQQVKDKYNNGFSFSEVFFGKEFAKACAIQACRMVAEKEFSFSESVFHYNRSIKNLNDSECYMGLAYFLNKLKEKIPEFFLDNEKPKQLNDKEKEDMESLSSMTVPKLKPEFAKEVLRVMNGELKSVDNNVKP